MKAVKIVVSSKDLAYHLSHIDFNGGEYIEDVRMTADVLEITTSNQFIKLQVNTSHTGRTIFDCRDARWDWARDMLNGIDEQPIVLELRDNCIRIIVTY